MTKAKAVATPTTNRTPAKSNYALPNTPIASAKRPRSSINKLIGLPSSTPLTPQNSTTPRVKNKDIDATRALNRDQMSPMHQVKHRIRVAKDELHESADNAAEGTSSSNIVDAIFSPMLKFLSGDEAEDRSITIGGDHENADFLLHAESSKNDDLEIDLSPREKRENEGERMSTGESDSKILEKRTNEEEDTTDLGFEVDEHSSQESEDYDDDEEEFNPYAFIKALPKYEEVKSLRPPVALPPKEADARPISLVLDLDETLVHCTVEACDDADFNFPVEFHGMTYQVYVRKRPYLKEFLENVAGKFEVIVFTASQQVYADALLNLIDPERKYIQHRMFRESCLSVEGNFLKDLNVLGRDLRKSVLVDNSPHAFGYQVDNGIPIESWFDDPGDKELLKLSHFLETLQGTDDVRIVVREKFKTYELIEKSPVLK